MSDYDHHIDLSDEPSEAEMQALARLLDDPGVWDEPDPALEDQVVAAILAEAAAAGPLTAPSRIAPPGPVTGAADQVVVPAESLASRRSRREGSRRAGWVLASGAAAACVVIIVLGLVALRGANPEVGGREVALARTDRVPADARGRAVIDERADGTRIVIDVKGLPPAAPGTYYEAWLRKNPEIGVSAGTFHLRAGGTEPIELWAGVSPRDYPLFTITIQREAEPASSGQVVLRAQLG